MWKLLVFVLREEFLSFPIKIVKFFSEDTEV